ncbi:MAG: hypothetical protein J6B00_04595 [Alphaproteobacteria bacterium]|nr:hypothetical protein [Alphaproteobacteria bacterium]
MKKTQFILIKISTLTLLALCYMMPSPLKAEENIPEDDTISCYTLIQNYPNWQKEKIKDPIIKNASSLYNCPNLPYKIYEGNAYNWQQTNAARPQNLPYLCIKDLKTPNRYNLLLKTPKLLQTLNNPNLGKNICTRLNFLLSAPQWTFLSD